MSLWDEAAGAFSDVASKAADIGKKAASDAKTFAGGFAQGANQVYQLPGMGTVKGALGGDPGDIARVGVAAAAVIPAERAFRALGVAREAQGLPIAERLGLGARAALESSPLYHGTTSVAADAIRSGGFTTARDLAAGERDLHGGFAGKTYVTTSPRTAARYARSASILSGDANAKPAVVLARAASAPLDTRTWGNKLGTELSFRSQDVNPVQTLAARVSGEAGKVTPFPDSTANMARRVKNTVMSAIAGPREAELTAKISATKNEIVQLGGTAPSGPFAAATPAKVAGIQSELADMTKRNYDPNAASRVADIKSKVAAAIKGGEGGMLKLPGTRAMDTGELKASTYAGRNYAQATRRGSGAVAAQNEKVMSAYGQSLDQMKTTAKAHAKRISSN